MTHHCDKPAGLEDAQYGHAVSECGDLPSGIYNYETRRPIPEGTLWVWNDEYATQVNFCPFCGQAAQVQVLK